MSVIVKGMKMPKECCDCPLHDGETGRCNIIGITVLDYIPKECPLVEVGRCEKGYADANAEQKRGKWIDRYRSKWDGTRYWFRACSECDFERDDCDYEKDTMYCPNCGAKMEM